MAEQIQQSNSERILAYLAFSSLQSKLSGLGVKSISVSDGRFELEVAYRGSFDGMKQRVTDIERVIEEAKLDETATVSKNTIKILSMAGVALPDWLDRQCVWQICNYINNKPYVRLRKELIDIATTIVSLYNKGRGKEDRIALPKYRPFDKRPVAEWLACVLEDLTLSAWVEKTANIIITAYNGLPSDKKAKLNDMRVISAAAYIASVVRNESRTYREVGDVALLREDSVRCAVDALCETLGIRKEKGTSGFSPVFTWTKDLFTARQLK